jgi:hydroxymethylpyrimidine/phosphomethylpyrimidine kinase
MGAAAVIITGGHASGPRVTDLLFDGRAFVELTTRRVGRAPVHGTGCTFASAVAAGLAAGRPVRQAAASAQRYVAGAIAHAQTRGAGARLIDHFWNVRLSPNAASACRT